MFLTCLNNRVTHIEATPATATTAAAATATATTKATAMWKAGDTRAVLDFLEHRQRGKQKQKTGTGGPGKEKTHSGALPPITTSATHPQE